MIETPEQKVARLECELRLAYQEQLQAAGVSCPCCRSTEAARVNGFARMYRCETCGALYGRTSRLLSLYLVLDEPHVGPPISLESAVYFDFQIIDLDGKPAGRRAGWFHPTTRRVVKEEA